MSVVVQEGNSFFFPRFDITEGPLPQDRLIAESIALKELGQLYVTSASLNHIIAKHEQFDMIFVSAFRTGKNPDEGGYGFYREGEVNRKGNPTTPGDKIGNRENKAKSASLAKDLRADNWAFIKLKGDYGAPEKSFLVMNDVEPLDTFIERVGSLANKYGQDSIFVWPKKGTGNPFFYYGLDGRREEAGPDTISNVENKAEGYFSEAQGKAFRVGSSKFFECVEGEIVPIDPNVPTSVHNSSLHIIRQGMPMGLVVTRRRRK